MLRRSRLALVVLAAPIVLVACASDGRTLTPPSPDQTASILVSTTTAPVATTDATIDGPFVTVPWTDGGPIPVQFTCKGADVSPTVGWSGLPDGTVEVGVAITDPDANDFVHWVVAGLDPADGQVAQGQVPEGAIQAKNDFGTVGYKGPCPSSGTHTYFITLYALKAASGMVQGSDPRQAITQLETQALSTAVVTGTATVG